jgi:hypothetical protein
MGRNRIAVTGALVVALLLVSGGTSAQAQVEGTASSDVVLAHGINTDGQSAQSEGGSTVTLCRDGSTFIGQFSFGDVIGPAAVEWGTVRLTAYDGADVDCAAPGVDALFDEDVEVRGSILLVVLTTVTDGEFGVLDVVLPPGCVESSELGRLVTVHASAALEPVEVTLDRLAAAGLSFGRSWGGDLEAGTYELGFDPVVAPFERRVGPLAYELSVLVGGIEGASPAVVLEYGFAGRVCPTADVPTGPSPQPTPPDPEATPAVPTPGTERAGRPLSLTG